jgi:hypothetical protein
VRAATDGLAHVVAANDAPAAVDLLNVRVDADALAALTAAREMKTPMANAIRRTASA